MQRTTIGPTAQLDEIATVDRWADTQLCQPVFQPSLEPPFDLDVFVDRSNSLNIWQSTLAEFCQML